MVIVCKKIIFSVALLSFLAHLAFSAENIIFLQTITII
jgi:hypothetical protein